MLATNILSATNLQICKYFHSSIFNFQIYPFCDLQLVPVSRLYRMNMKAYMKRTVCRYICDVIFLHERI